MNKAEYIAQRKEIAYHLNRFENENTIESIEKMEMIVEKLFKITREYRLANGIKSYGQFKTKKRNKKMPKVETLNKIKIYLDMCETHTQFEIADVIGCHRQAVFNMAKVYDLPKAKKAYEQRYYKKNKETVNA